MKNKIKSEFYSPLRYPGGKTRLANFLVNAIGKNFKDGEKVILVEPYAGGAGASLALLFEGIVDRIVINDLDRAIYAFWKIAVTDTDYLINKILKTDISIKEWEKQKLIYNNPFSSDRKLAFATLFLNRTNRSGIIEGGPIGGFAQNGIWKLNARFTKKTIMERLEKIKVNRKKIKVSNLDGVSLLERIEQQSKARRHFIFLDPPYYQKGSSLYLNHYKNKDHEKLNEFLKDSSLKWVMTYDDVSYIKNLYEKMRKRKFEIQHSAYKSKIGKEVLIFSDNIVLASL